MWECKHQIPSLYHDLEEELAWLCPRGWMLRLVDNRNYCSQNFNMFHYTNVETSVSTNLSTTNKVILFSLHLYLLTLFAYNIQLCFNNHFIFVAAKAHNC